MTSTIDIRCSMAATMQVVFEAENDFIALPENATMDEVGEKLVAVMEAVVAGLDELRPLQARPMSPEVKAQLSAIIQRLETMEAAILAKAG